MSRRRNYETHQMVSTVNHLMPMNSSLARPLNSEPQKHLRILLSTTTATVRSQKMWMVLSSAYCLKHQPSKQLKSQYGRHIDIKLPLTRQPLVKFIPATGVSPLLCRLRAWNPPPPQYRVRLTANEIPGRLRSRYNQDPTLLNLTNRMGQGSPKLIEHSVLDIYVLLWTQSKPNYS